uniref:Uncharacterized protein n=1 Tax=Gasterosteus aculeatus TaxID=69293 RepID=G3PS68_GASAC
MLYMLCVSIATYHFPLRFPGDRSVLISTHSNRCWKLSCGTKQTKSRENTTNTLITQQTVSSVFFFQPSSTSSTPVFRLNSTRKGKTMILKLRASRLEKVRSDKEWTDQEFGPFSWLSHIDDSSGSLQRKWTWRPAAEIPGPTEKSCTAGSNTVLCLNSTESLKSQLISKSSVGPRQHTGQLPGASV